MEITVDFLTFDLMHQKQPLVIQSIDIAASFYSLINRLDSAVRKRSIFQRGVCPLELIMRLIFCLLIELPLLISCSGL